jgi:hypothetical protein
MIACFLAALLAVEGPASATTSDKVSCDVTDNRCKAKDFERQAEQASSPSQRALYLQAAYRSYMGLHKKTGKVRDLCEARRAFEASLAVKGLPASQRASFEEGRAELESREQQSNAQCGNSAKRRARATAARSAEKPAPKPEAVMAAAAPEPETAASVAAPETLIATESEARAADEPPDLLPVRSEKKRSARPRAEAAVRPEALPPSPAPVAAPPRHGRPLVIAGSVTLGLGLSLAGVAGYAGRRALEAHRAGVELHNEVQGPPDEAARAEDAALEREYRKMGSLALGTAVVGGAAVIVGTALVAVGGRRLARTASSTALVPFPGGLAFHARF